MLGDQQILQHGHAGKQTDVLERAGDPRLLRHQIVGHALEQEQRAVRPNHAALAARGEVFKRAPHRRIAAMQRETPLGRPIKAGDAIEYGGLAGAVRPDQCRDRAAPDLERQIVDGDETAEAHRQVFDTEHGGGVLCHQPWPSLTRSTDISLRSLRNTEGSRVAIRPRGRQIMISTMARPNSSMRYCVGSKVGPKICLRNVS